jgi:hypothetical protein
MQRPTAAYIELTKDGYTLVLDTFASATRSRFSFWKSVWDIVMRPYASTAIGPAIRDNVDRANELAGLTVGEYCSRVERGADFSQKLLAHVGKLQGAALGTYRDAFSPNSSAVDQAETEPTKLPAKRPSEPIAVLETYRGLFRPQNSTAQEVTNVATELSAEGFKHRKTRADHVSSN